MVMYKLVRLLLTAFLAVVVNGFIPSRIASTRGFVAPKAIVARTSLQVKVAVARKSNARAAALEMAVASQETSSKYWEGEWVCADCGYIYDVDDCGGLYFEQQRRGFVCPQCRGPRRRFAKKVGDKVGITQDGGDAPILFFSFVGLAVTVAFGFWFAGQ